MKASTDMNMTMLMKRFVSMSFIRLMACALLWIDKYPLLVSKTAYDA